MQNIIQICLKTVLKVVLLLDFWYVQILIWALYAIFVWRKICICGLAEVFSPLKIRSANRKFAKRPENLTICGFAICGTYLRTAHLCYLHSYIHKVNNCHKGKRCVLVRYGTRQFFIPTSTPQSTTLWCGMYCRITTWYSQQTFLVH